MIRLRRAFVLVAFLSAILACSEHTSNALSPDRLLTKEEISNEGLEVATFGAGCFWCVEAIFQELKGIESVTSGYIGGHTSNPTYKDVSSGKTGYAEVARIIFDPEIISFEELLEVFWTTHDPTTLNRQGHDEGTQYRSGVWYHNAKQKKLAEESKSSFATKLWNESIVTEISPITKYYRAEDYHQNYYNNNPNQGYCMAIINPKVIKFRKKFKSKLKSN